MRTAPIDDEVVTQEVINAFESSTNEGYHPKRSVAQTLGETPYRNPSHHASFNKID